jgi:hypothetical protein
MLEILRVPYGANYTKPSVIESSASEASIVVPIRSGGKIIFTSPDQKWFWTEEWQAGELQVEEYIRDGNIQTFDTIEEFLRTLRE